MNIQSKCVFTVPVTKVRVAETEALKQQFLPEMLRRYEAQPQKKPPEWETDRVHSSFNASKGDWVIATLPPAYERLVRRFTEGYGYAVQLWHNVYWTREEYQERHHHIPAHLSFIHFLAFDRAEHKAPVFYDPARLIKAHCRHDALPPEIWEETAQLDVEEGDALVFPSYLEHHVPPGRYSKPRVSVSMNVTLQHTS